MAHTRRDLLSQTANLALGTGLFMGCRAEFGLPSSSTATASQNGLTQTKNGVLESTMSIAASGTYVPCITPGIPTLEFEWEGSVKVFRLRAEPVTLEFPDMSDGMGMKMRKINAWGYSGSSPGPTIECVEGDTVRIIVENGLPEDTTVHWHGLHIPLGMDGVPGLSQPPIPPGGTFTYEFTLEQHGTYFYHSHVMQAKQVGLGLMGFFIVHPKQPEPWMLVDRDFAYFLHTWMIHPGSPNPDNMEMSEFNYFTFNGRTGNNIVPMAAKKGEKVRIRVTNLSMLVHPVHIHGHTARLTEYGAGFVPPSQQIPLNTVNVSSAEVRVLEFEAKRLGKWLFHCHFVHHTMDDMHRAPIPGSGGSHAGHQMDSGGMHTHIEIT